jgi:hypothetical protein
MRVLNSLSHPISTQWSSNLFALILPFVNLLLFRAGPQDVPASKSALKIVIAACFITDVMGAVGLLGLPLSAMLSAGQIALYGGFVYLLLKINKKTERWLQTLTALFGALTLINLASYPFIQNLNLISDGQLVLTPGLLIVAVLQLWFFIVMARILRDANEITLGRAILLTFLIINLIPLVLSSLVGVLGLSPVPLTIDSLNH